MVMDMLPVALTVRYLNANTSCYCYTYQESRLYFISINARVRAKPCFARHPTSWCLRVGPLIAFVLADRDDNKVRVTMICSSRVLIVRNVPEQTCFVILFEYADHELPG